MNSVMHTNNIVINIHTQVYTLARTHTHTYINVHLGNSTSLMHILLKITDEKLNISIPSFSVYINLVFSCHKRIVERFINNPRCKKKIIIKNVFFHVLELNYV